MRQFFRLLFFSFGLLILLGMNAHQSTGTDDCKPPASITISFSDHQAALIPAYLTDEFIPQVSSWTLLSQRQFTPEHKEIFTSSRIRSRLHCCLKHFMEYSPGILQKKGIPVFQPTQKDDSSLA